jgi:CopG family transcriptional regulator, nickel-responsive regulator
MGELVRFGVSIDSKLLSFFDELIAAKGYTNRSEAIRDLIRDRLVETRWEKKEEESIGIISIVYNHQVRELMEKLADLQHQNYTSIVSTLHLHLDQHNCLEVLIVKGKIQEIRKIADNLIATKGVLHGRLTFASTGKDLY